MLRRLAEDQEGPAEVGGDHRVEALDVRSGNREQRHDACRVDDHIDAAKAVDGVFEEPFDVCCLGNIRLNRDGACAGCLEFGDDLRGLRRIAGVADGDGESVAGEPLRDRAADTTGSPCYERGFRFSRHDFPVGTSCPRR
jgi:hypothetical protein